MSEEALQTAVKRRQEKGKGEKAKEKRYTYLNAEKIYLFECRVPKKSKER